MNKIKSVILFIALLFSTDFASAKSDSEITNDSIAKSAKGSTGEVIVINKNNFLKKIYNYEKNPKEWVYEGNIPCIIYFYANWCPHCKTVDPILKELAKEYKGKIIIYKTNMDNERELASIFSVSSVPAYSFIPTKGNPQSLRSVQTRETFVKIINEFLLK